MGTLPVVLVFPEEVPAALPAALAEAGFLYRAAGPQDAAQSVNDGWAELVVCARFPGWQALLARVHTAGGATVLWGPPPADSELRLVARGEFECAADPAGVLEALRRSILRLASRRAEPEDRDGLHERAECAERVSRFAQSIALQLDLPHVVQEAISRARDLCDADGASLHLVDPRTGELPPGRRLAAQIARTAQPLLVTSVREGIWLDPELEDQQGFAAGSLIAAPLVVGGDLLGVLEAVRGTDQPAFLPAHLRRLTELAPHVGIAVFNAQISERLREAQAEALREVRQRAMEQRQRDGERLASLAQLASGAAHEINNPLGFLTSNLRNLRQLIEELASTIESARQAQKSLAAGQQTQAARQLTPAAELPEEVITDGYEMVDDALDGAHRVAEIVRALREMSRQQVGQEIRADVNACVTRAVRAELGSGPQKVELQLAAQEPAAIDPLQLDQVLGHLLRNARQAVNGDQRVVVRTRSMTEEVELDVEDEGCGIPPENLGRVFEPFFTTRGVGKGVGLGLTASWGIVQRHGGHIEVSSKPGGGTTFKVFLPRATSEHTSA